MKHCLILLALLCGFYIPIFAQRNNNGANTAPQDTTVYFINNIEFNITGKTRPFAIMQKIELSYGQEITGLVNLERFIQNKAHDLNNQRVLESSSIEYTIGAAAEDGRFPVDLVITAKDTWNILPLPYPKYDDNTGTELTLKIRHYNFLGTMNPLRVDIGFRNDQYDRTFFNLMAETDIPFYAVGVYWNVRIHNTIQYRPDMSEPYYSNHILGLSAAIPAGRSTFTIGINESLFINQEISDDYIPLYGDVHSGLYLSTGPYVSWSIPSKFEIGNYGPLRYSASLSAAFNHEISGAPLPMNRIGPFLTFDHSLGFGRVNWLGNFRNGFSASLTNNYNYDFYDYANGTNSFSYGISAGFNYHKSIDDHLGISLKAMYRQYFLTTHTNAGDVLRGIVDNNIDADIMFSLNLDLSMGIMKVRPSEWFNVSWFRVFNFDMQLSPFIDIAFYRSPSNELKFSDAHFTYKNLLLCGGMEVIIFSKFARSIFFRVSVGFNWSTLTGLSSREIYIGTELHY